MLVIHNWEDNHNCRGLPKEWGVQGLCWAFQSMGPAPGRWAHKHLPFNASRAYVWKSWRVIGNKTLLLEGTCKIPHNLNSSTEAIIRKEPVLNALADLRESPGEAGGKWDTPWVHRHWQHHFWVPFLPWDTGAGTLHFGVLSPTY